MDKDLALNKCNRESGTAFAALPTENYRQESIFIISAN